MLILLEDVNHQISKICEKFGGFFFMPKSGGIPLVVNLQICEARPEPQMGAVPTHVS